MLVHRGFRSLLGVVLGDLRPSDAAAALTATEAFLLVGWPWPTASDDRPPLEERGPIVGDAA